MGIVLNKHFINFVRSVAEKNDCSAHVFVIIDEKDPLENIVTRFRFHPSIMVIKQKNFKEVLDLIWLTMEEVLAHISKLNQTKSTTGISISLLKDDSKI